MRKFLRHHSVLCKSIGLAAAIAIFAIPTVRAEDGFPNKPIYIVVPYAPGGGVDIVTRLVSHKMGERLKQTVIVDNRPGAATNIGMDVVARSKPDGYMLLTASNTLACNPALFSNMTFDPARDLIPIGKIGYAPLIVVVPENSRFKTLQSMIAFGKANPDKLTYGSAGNGSSGHLASELLKLEAGFDALHIPYKGGAQAINDLLGERISFMSINPLEVVSHIRAKKLRPIAAMDRQPVSLFPSVPTVTSLGLSGSSASVWWGLVGPKGLPPEIVVKLNTALRSTLADPSVVARMDEMGATVTPSSAAEYGAFIKSETAKWSMVIKKANIKAD